MEIRRRQDAFSRLLRACALQEIGRHDEALELALLVRRDCETSDESLAADLIEALIVGCRGDHERARELLVQITASPNARSSALVGYAHRFFEIVDHLEAALAHLFMSIECFRRNGFRKSQAYSQLPAGILLARLGNIDRARALIAEATSMLAGEVRDQHIILNNWCAVELLSDDPDFIECRDRLNLALRCARDDFSELTILTNLGLSLLGMRDLTAAVGCAEKCLLILRNHDFADADIYWPVAFNLRLIYGQAGMDNRLLEVQEFLRLNGRHRGDQLYWDYRFGTAAKPPESHRFLCTRKWHPVYLSHWIIDMEGLMLLKRERLQ